MASERVYGGLSPDWVYSNNSNVHACNDRRWFTKFTPFTSTASARLDSQHHEVAGVGTVDLPVKRGPDLSGPQAHHVLRLTNVLYTPTSVCNIVGQPIFELAAQVSFRIEARSAGSIIAANGKPLAYFDPTQKQQFCIKLSDPPIGPQLGPSQFQPNRKYIVRIMWSGSERERWENRGRGPQTDAKQDPWTGEKPYNADEKAWLMKHYGGEVNFLEACELRIYSEEDRAEGRVIMRIMSAMDCGKDNE